MKPELVRNTLITSVAAIALVDIFQAVLVVARTNGATTRIPEADVVVLVALVPFAAAVGSLFATAMLAMRHVWSVLLAGGAALMTIASEIVRVVAIQQVSAALVLGSLAVVAMAEYLWFVESEPHRSPSRTHEVLRVVLVALQGFIALSAIGGGAALARGAFDEVLPVAWLAGTPFSTYTLPGLSLVIVVGGSALVGAATAFVHREWAVLASVLSGIMLAAYLIVEIACIDTKVGGDALPMVLALQFGYLVSALAVVVLAGYLWLGEYPRQPAHLRQARYA
jgi:hypothetical protein